MSQADEIRKFTYETYVVPAIGHRLEFTIRAGNVHDLMGLQNRVPNVCNALRGNKFQRMSHIQLIGEMGPQSGEGPNMTFTYRFKPNET